MAAAASGVLYAVFAATSMWVTVTDLRTRRIPNRVIAIAAAAIVGCGAVSAFAAADARRWVWAAVAAAIYGGAAFALWLAVPNGAVGGGDVKLAPLIGFATGWSGIDAAFGWAPIGIAAAALAAVAWARFRRRDVLAFGPVLLAGAWIAILITWW
ncbi:hypothetical protein GCM10009847_20510 [Leucobacter tardus]|uniref:Prepilin peptidase n=1 Tax=Leucobacter tardus TaxID=501483 RepID=A0A939TNP6_9MICO|nr:prepilin peptidase [Leucobacter tardus]MBO2990434.1 prepilin peptidase [Leucobacter tardus]